MTLMQKQMGLMVTAAFLFASQPGTAQDATAVDRIAVQQCLDGRISAGEERERCVGVIADRCLEKGDDPSTFGMADCSRREHAVWDERLNAAYRKLLKDLDANQ